MSSRLVDSDNALKCICGNKYELPSEDEAGAGAQPTAQNSNENNIKVTDADVEDMVLKCQIQKKFKVSAKKGENIQQMFIEIAQHFADK